ncbi:MAG: ribbon-helix-helix protein, CopG family [Balneolaceae bacterium]|nr:ribbon-helix-helix protein, CopG family [Balneolaceae bacterium]
MFRVMDTTLSIRIDKDLESLLNQVAKRTGRPKSELVREALRRQLSIESFQQVRNRILPFAESQGLLTDEDVWREIS